MEVQRFFYVTPYDLKRVLFSDQKLFSIFVEFFMTIASGSGSSPIYNYCNRTILMNYNIQLVGEIHGSDSSEQIRVACLSLFDKDHLFIEDYPGEGYTHVDDVKILDLHAAVGGIFYDLDHETEKIVRTRCALYVGELPSFFDLCKKCIAKIMDETTLNNSEVEGYLREIVEGNFRNAGICFSLLIDARSRIQANNIMNRLKYGRTIVILGQNHVELVFQILISMGYMVKKTDAPVFLRMEKIKNFINPTQP